ncbi:MAG: DUF3866 family protein [Acidimicrobiia bacterium]|nr:DUF3866 family protein [Acidimicrobiia bacterium]
MPTFKTGRVASILNEREGLQRVTVDLGAGLENAFVLTQLTGDVSVGSNVVVNTTAVELGLGTGGWHVIHWNLDRAELSEIGPGHIMKLRYTSLQVDAGSAEESHPELLDANDIGGMPVVYVPLHSQLPAAVLGIRSISPRARIAYVMTDGAALPIAFSDLVASLRERSLIDATVTSGHAFGGDFEAVSAPAALLTAKIAGECDVAVVGMGPGIVGTGSKFGHTGVEGVSWLDTARALGGVPVASLRVSFADERVRHQGVSHHTLNSLSALGADGVHVVVPMIGGEEESKIRSDLHAAGIDQRHEIVSAIAPDILGAFAEHNLEVGSMGRPASADPVLFLAAGAAGAYAAQRIPAES